MNILDDIIKKAKSDIQTIVLPEGKDARVVEAAKELKNQNIVNPIVLVNEQDLNQDLKALETQGIRVVVIEKSPDLNDYIDKLYELRKAKGLTREAAKKLLENTIYFGVMMVKFNEADGMVAGSMTATGDVLRPALQILRTAKNVKLVSSFFIMEVPKAKDVVNDVFAFSDCGLVVNPNQEELAEIAIETAKSYDFITGKEPLVGMLSFSTFGSAQGELVDKVVNATNIVKEKYPNLKVDGEMQLDAAIIPKVAKLKAPDSRVAGYANVLIFPDLQAGNIGYKLVQRLAGANAYGPITQGLAKPVNDLSRGCSSQDIIAVAAITALQAQAQKQA